MATITFNAFSFLQKKLRDRGVAYANVTMEIQEGISAAQLLEQVKLARDEVEVAFINGKVKPFSTPLKHDDRVAFVPPGTPGPYRVLLGFKNKQ